MLAQDVGRGQRVVRPERRVLDERRIRGQGGGQGHDGRQWLAGHADEAGCLLGGIGRVGGDRRDRLTVVVGLADGDDRSVLELRPEARHRVGQVGGGQHGPDAGHGQRGGGVDGVDPRPCVVDRHEPDVQLAIEMDVGDVVLLAGDPVQPADADRRLADHAVTSASAASAAAAASTASMICS